jgi:hypothetical protein
MTAPYELRPVGYLESPLVDRETAPKQGVGWHDLAGGHALLQPDQLQLQATRKVGLGIGPTRDLVLIEGTAPALTAIDFPDQVGDAFAAKTGFDPRQLSDYLYFRIQPGGSKHGGKPASSRTATSCGPDTGSSLAEQETVVSARHPYRTVGA